MVKEIMGLVIISGELAYPLSCFLDCIPCSMC